MKDTAHAFTLLCCRPERLIPNARTNMYLSSHTSSTRHLDVDTSLLIGCLISVRSEGVDFEINRGDMRGETAFMAIGAFLSWFNWLKYLEWDIQVCLV